MYYKIYNYPTYDTYPASTNKSWLTFEFWIDYEIKILKYCCINKMKKVFNYNDLKKK